MIDWVSFSLPYSGPPVGVQYLRRETWDGPIEPAYARAVSLEGSYSAKVQVQAIGGRLYVSGNPVKFFTGQNVAGTNDLPRLVRLMVGSIWDRLQLVPCLDAWRALDTLDVRLTRVDCTFSYRVGSDDDVVTWLEAMERACHVRFRGRGHFDQGMCSLMFGLTLQEGQKAKASRRSTFKFYNKLREMAAHPPTCDAATAALLRETVCGTVRGEACYRALELQAHGRDRLSAWTQDTARELHRAWVSKMEIAQTFTLKSKQERDLPRWLQSTYRHWRAGEDVRGLLSRRTFYRQRKELLELVGIDIAQPRVVSADPVRVIPVLRVLEAKPEPEEELEALFWRLADAA